METGREVAISYTISEDVAPADYGIPDSAVIRRDDHPAS
jgi:hypothetical protein